MAILPIIGIGQYVSAFLADTDIVIIPRFTAKSDGPVKKFSIFILDNAQKIHQIVSPATHLKFSHKKGSIFG